MIADPFTSEIASPGFPKFICINLKRAEKRRTFTCRYWFPLLGEQLVFHEAVDHRDLPPGRIRDSSGRCSPLTRGEAACLMSHLSALAAHGVTAGEEGVVIMEDDVKPVDGAEHLFQRILKVRAEAPEVDYILLCEPVNRYGISRKTIGLDIAGSPAPFGMTMVWFSARGAGDFIQYKSGFQSPADHWQIMCRQERLAVLRRPVAIHIGGDTYVGNRPDERKYIP